MFAILARLSDLAERLGGRVGRWLGLEWDDEAPAIDRLVSPYRPRCQPRIGETYWRYIARAHDTNTRPIPYPEWSETASLRAGSYITTVDGTTQAVDEMLERGTYR